MAAAYPGARGLAAFPSPRCLACANCCVVFATSGVLFLTLIGTLLDRQPLYVLGVDEPAKASVSCFAAARYYGFIVLMSIATLAYDRCRPHRPPVAAGSLVDDRFGPGAVDERLRRRAYRDQAPAVELTGPPPLLDTDFESKGLI